MEDQKTVKITIEDLINKHYYLPVNTALIAILGLLVEKFNISEEEFLEAVKRVEKAQNHGSRK